MIDLPALEQAPLPATVTRRLDEAGLLCPLPIVHLAAALKAAAMGDILHVISTDPGFIADLARWLRVRPHRLLALRQDAIGQKYQAWILRG